MTETVPTIANPVYRGETCRACKTELVFVQTEKGRREPLERLALPGDRWANVAPQTPVSAMRLVVVRDGQAQSLGLKRAQKLGVDVDQAKTLLHVSHFATCPHRDRFRRSG